MSRQLITVTILIISGLLAIIAGCSEDCPTCPMEVKPQPYKGYLYYVDYNLDYYDVYVIDTETDSIVDSIDVPGRATGGIDVSADGRYLAVVAEEEPGIDDDPMVVKLHTYLYDAQTRAFIREFPTGFLPFFDVKHNRMVGMGRYLSGSYFSVYSYPDLQLTTVDTVDWIGGDTYDTDRNLIYAGGLTETPYRYRFFSYNLSSHQLKMIPIVQDDGDSVQVFRHCLNRSGTRLYFKALTPNDPPFVACYDLEANRLIWQFRTMSWVGWVALSPDESELWMTDPGEGGYINNTGTVFILDAATGTYLEGISLWGYPSNTLTPLAGNRIVFALNGNQVYVATGATGDRPPGSVLAIDWNAREITKIISPDLRRAVANMCLGPKLE